MQGDCERIQDGLLFFCEEEGDGEDTPLIAEHLKRCRSCRERVETIRILNGWLTSLPRRVVPGEELLEGAFAPFIARLPERKLPAGFDRKILEAVREEKARESVKVEGVAWRALQPLAAAAAILALSLLSFRTLDPQPSYPRALNFNFSVGRSLYSHKFSPFSGARASAAQEVSKQMDPRGSTSSDRGVKGNAK